MKSFFKGIREFIKVNVFFILTNLLLISVLLIYLIFRWDFINAQVPLWYGLPWGTSQLEGKSGLYLFPLIVVVVSALSMLLSNMADKIYLRFGSGVIKFLAVFSNVMLTFSFLRIVMLSSKPFDPIFNPTHLELFAWGIVSVLVVYFITPFFIDFVKKRGIVTNPQSHAHPGMVLARPSARGGGLVFVIGLLAVTSFSVRPTIEILMIYFSAAFLGLLGLLDDYQNTHPGSKLSFLERPELRFGLLILVAATLVFSGIRIDFISDFSGGVIRFDTFSINLIGQTFYPISIVLTILWIVWILNLLSWSNGIDAQYCGIISVAGIITAVLALRFVPLDPNQLNLAKLMFVVAGASLGLLPYNWHPSKIMWGFGAMSAGIILASVSILIGSKISTTVLVLLIPFVDALVTLGRRILQKKNPLKGDKGHLHHLLLQRGWTPPQVAGLYWGGTLVFGIIGIIASGVFLIQITLILFALLAGMIIFLHLTANEASSK